jgi:membrane glycosyltransferase
MTVRHLDSERLPIRYGRRVFVFFGLALLLTGVISLLFADLLWRRGWTNGSTVLFGLFVLLLLLNSIGAMHGIYGFFLQRGGDPRRITNLRDFSQQDISGTSVAVLFPIYNEEASEVYARLRATFESLKKTGHLDSFDFHILSDSTDPANWVDEEVRWIELTKSLDAFGRLFYRRRLLNEAKKSGNIRDFLNDIGNRYRYFVVFDADSFVTGRTLVSLVQMMEAHPEVGIIQTPPALLNAESLFGRLHQFANRLYSPGFTSGLNYWMQDVGNYLGHNAIIRTAPFMQYCGLPRIPGKKPFGGQILSHDFVEAALMLKNHWDVWLAYDLDGTYEEGPQGLIEYAQRDRRWCQGNLQHILVLFARGLHGISRLHFIFGIFAYLSGPLWLAFLLTFNAQLFFHRRTGLSDITVQPWTPFLKLSATQHALLIFGLSTLVLLTPKILALIDLALDPPRRRAFGGMARASLSAFLEFLFSTLQAPLLMLWHTEFVITILLGRSVNWGKQQRRADGTSWKYALQQHWKDTLIGIAWGAVLWRMDRTVFWWFVPVLAGMLLAIPFTVITSRCKPGAAARRAGLFLTPEETEPSQDIVLLRSALAHSAAASEREKEQLIPQVILDPYYNALHRALLPDSQDPRLLTALKSLRKDQPEIETLQEKAIHSGIEGLGAKEKLLLLSEPDALKKLRKTLWITPAERLAESWRNVLNRQPAS